MKSSFKSSIFYLRWSTFSNAKSHLMTWNMFKNKKTRNQKFKQQRWKHSSVICHWTDVEKGWVKGVGAGGGKASSRESPFCGSTDITDIQHQCILFFSVTKGYSPSFIHFSHFHILCRCQLCRIWANPSTSTDLKNIKYPNIHCVKYAAHNSTLMALREPLNNMLWEETSVHTGLSWARIVLTFWSVWMSHTYARCTVGGEMHDANKWASRRMKTFHREIL